MSATDDGVANPPAAPGSAGGLSAPVRARKYGRMFIGWVLLPLFIASALVAAGVHQAAYHPDAWYTRAVQMLTSLH